MAIMKEGEDRLTPDQFCYWFQGFAELHGEVPTKEQWDSIKRHLELVFRPVTRGETLKHPTEPRPIPQSVIDAIAKDVDVEIPGARRKRYPPMVRFERQPIERIC
jgi:hypothetical protein